MPIMAWLHYADHALDPIRRSSSGSYVAIADKPPSETERNLRALVLRLDNLQKMRTQESNRLEVARDRVKDDIVEHLQKINEKIKEHI